MYKCEAEYVVEIYEWKVFVFVKNMTRLSKSKSISTLCRYWAICIAVSVKISFPNFDTSVVGSYAVILKR